MAHATDRAIDRAAADLAVYAPEQIGRTRYRTPEGFLFCEGARIARTGPMMYAQKEMPDIEPGTFSSMIVIERDEAVLFDPDSIASYAGKAITNDHPPEPVTPANFKKYAVGTILNPRRGEGVEISFLIADLLIMDEDAIEAIEPSDKSAPKVELSAGYDTEVEQIKPGVGRQTKNVGNHVALVEKGRAGPACSIKDEDPVMATKKTRRVLDAIRKAFRAKDEAGLEEHLTQAEGLMDDDDEGGGADPQTVVIKFEGPGAPAAGEASDEAGGAEGEKPDPYEARFKGIEDCLSGMKDAFEKLTAAPAADAAEGEGEGEKVFDEEAEEAKEEEKEADKTTAQDAMSKAEILAPGIKLPVADAKSKMKRSAITDLRRTALKTAVADSARKAHVDAVLGGRAADFDKMRPSQVAMVFDAASAVASASNNRAATPRPFDTPQGPMTAAKYQERIQERRKARA